MGVNVVNAQPAKTQRVDPQLSAHRAPSDGLGLSIASPIHKLQRTVGNRAMNSLLRSRIVQPKLTLSYPDDEYEREADRVSDQVMRMPEPQFTGPVDGSPLRIQRLRNKQPTPFQMQRMCRECKERGDPAAIFNRRHGRST